MIVVVGPLNCADPTRVKDKPPWGGGGVELCDLLWFVTFLTTHTPEFLRVIPHDTWISKF